MFIRRALWLLSFAQIYVGIDAGFWDSGNEVGSDESQPPPSGKVEYGVDMVRYEWMRCISLNWRI
jgi:hypothetical protein